MLIPKLRVHPVRQNWKNMLNRCGQGNTQRRDKNWRWYADLGIRVCDEWLSFNTFLDWSITNGWAKGLTIDRIDPTKNYEPGNCRWITRSENAATGRRAFSVYPGHRVGVRGSANHYAKIDEATVLKIIKDKRSPYKTAAEYGLCVQHIYAIRTGKAWKHLHAEDENSIPA